MKQNKRKETVEFKEKNRKEKKSPSCGAVLLLLALLEEPQKTKKQGFVSRRPEEGPETTLLVVSC